MSFLALSHFYTSRTWPVIIAMRMNKMLVFLSSPFNLANPSEYMQIIYMFRLDIPFCILSLSHVACCIQDIEGLLLLLLQLDCKLYCRLIELMLS